MIYRKLQIKYGVDLPASTKIGPGFKIEHLSGIVVNPDVVIGKNCNIYNGVTIGKEKRGVREGCPTIADKVWIGANAVVVGSIQIAETFVCDIEKMHVYHFRPSVLPNLGAVGEKAGVMKQDTNFENPHRNKAANPLSSFVRMGYYWLDYLIGGAICIRKDVQFDKITIFDRSLKWRD